MSIEIEKREPTLVERLRVIVPERDRAFAARQRLVRTPQLAQHAAGMVVRLGVIGPLCNGAAVALQRFVEAFEIAKNIARDC